MSTHQSYGGRVVLAKVGLDGHDRGVKVVARALRDAGFEVIYLGLRTHPTEIARVAMDEDADLIGLSFLSGAHLGLTREVLETLRGAGLSDIPVVVGGTIPARDTQALLSLGVAHVFPVGTPLADLVSVAQGVTRQPATIESPANPAD